MGEDSPSLAVTSLVACERISNEEQSQGGGLRHVIGMPGDTTHASPSTHSSTSTSIRQSDHLTFSSQIPNDGISRTAGASEDVLRLVVPCDKCNLIELRTTRPGSWRVRFSRVFEIPNVHLWSRD
jgi:hypothetical protein